MTRLQISPRSVPSARKGVFVILGGGNGGGPRPAGIYSKQLGALDDHRGPGAPHARERGRRRRTTSGSPRSPRPRREESELQHHLRDFHGMPAPHVAGIAGADQEAASKLDAGQFDDERWCFPPVTTLDELHCIDEIFCD